MLTGIGPNRIVFGGEQPFQFSLTLERDGEGRVGAATEGSYLLSKADAATLAEWLQDGETWKRHLPAKD